MNQLHPSEIFNQFEVRRYATKGSIGCLVAGFVLVGATGFVAPSVRPFVLGSSFLCLWSGRQSRRLVQATDDILTDYRDISDQSRQNRIFELMKPTVEVVTTSEVERDLFDWSLFETDPDRYVHPAYVGATGSGKSSLAEWLCRSLSGRVIAIAPHWKPGDFQGLVCHAKGRQYGDKESRPVEFDDLFDGSLNLSAMTVIATLFDEMNRRYSQRLKGATDFDPVNVIIDECLSILDEVKQFIDYVRPLLREARKVGIRLHLLLQDDSVKSLKIEGQGAIRKNLTYIRLGEFAVSHAKSLKNRDLEKWVREQSRPCLVEDKPAEIPDLTPIVGAIVDGEVLPENLERIWSYVLTRGEPVTASQVKSGLRSCRTMTTDQIREIFGELVGRGYGSLSGDNDGLKLEPG